MGRLQISVRLSRFGIDHPYWLHAVHTADDETHPREQRYRQRMLAILAYRTSPSPYARIHRLQAPTKRGLLALFESLKARPLSTGQNVHYLAVSICRCPQLILIDHLHHRDRFQDQSQVQRLGWCGVDRDSLLDNGLLSTYRMLD